MKSGRGQRTETCSSKLETNRAERGSRNWYQQKSKTEPQKNNLRGQDDFNELLLVDLLLTGGSGMKFCLFKKVKPIGGYAKKFPDDGKENKQMML